MRLFNLAILTILMTTVGCSTSVATNQTRTASNIVKQADSSKVEHISISDLHDSFVHKDNATDQTGCVVKVSGTVVSFEMTDEQLYIVTLKDNESEAICVFDDSIASRVGQGREIEFGAQLSIQGQCAATGLFSSTPFTLDGCQIVQ